MNVTNIPSYPEFQEEYLQEPVIDDIRNVLYPSKLIEEMVGGHKVHLDKVNGSKSLFWIPIGLMPAITRYAYEAGYNQAMKDIEKDKEKSKKIPDESL